LDTEVFYPTDPAPIYTRFGLNPRDQSIILHPHRPEPGKGLFETIQVVDTLKNAYGFNNIKVLVPQWLDVMNGEAESSFHSQISTELTNRGLSDNFIFHEWVSQSEMAAYYSAGQLTLCLGNMGSLRNVAYESLICGTPSIAARVGVHRSQLPDDLLTKVDYGDTAAAAAAAAGILQTKTRVGGERLERIRETFSLSRQLETYERIICEAEKRNIPKLSRCKQVRTALFCWRHGATRAGREYSTITMPGTTSFRNSNICWKKRIKSAPKRVNILEYRMNQYWAGTSSD
jgi:glycosyltransferase involved in cell wall biosynthesis